MVEAFNKLVAQFMDKSFVQDGIPVVAKRVVEFLHNKACEILKTLVEQVQQQMERI